MLRPSQVKNLDLRMNHRDNSYLAKRDLGPEKISDLPKVTWFLAVKLGLEPSLLPCRCTQRVGHSDVLTTLHTGTKHPLWARPGDRGWRWYGGGWGTCPDSGAHSPGENMHVHTGTPTTVTPTGPMMKVQRAGMEGRGGGDELHQGQSEATVGRRWSLNHVLKMAGF